MKQEWTLTALYSEMKKDLNLCTTSLEKQLCESICRKEIRDKAVEIQKTRKLTPGEMSVLLNV